jgi:hypothetical protein
MRPFKFVVAVVLLRRTMPWVSQDWMPQRVKIDSRKIAAKSEEPPGYPDGSSDLAGGG